MALAGQLDALEVSHVGQYSSQAGKQRAGTPVTLSVN
jgi:hypothetical protein